MQNRGSRAPLVALAADLSRPLAQIAVSKELFAEFITSHPQRLVLIIDRTTNCVESRILFQLL